ncbi:hypothetical protein H2203_001628 [Taxawa tesnikishii (nom. ined.)]|nr:hypothetical protein H2203_001628 [Dothideales sp. JES 119]
MAPNAAAWLTAPKARPLEVKPAPTWTPDENGILVQNHAIAINPVDAAVQAFDPPRFMIKYPTILGSDVAGVVVAVGSKVTRFKKGDRVVGQAVGMATKRDQDNGFQSHTILNEHMASELPDSVPYENAAVIPLGLSTAACGLFQEAPFLHLRFPTEPAQSPIGQTVLIWGGSSSVGSNAIQLAVAAGYEVICTASPKNFDYVRGLGASQAFDYNSPAVTEDLVNACEGKTVAGALDCIGGDATAACADFVHRTAGSGAVATTKGGYESPYESVSVKNVFGTTLKDNAVGPAVYVDFLPKALQAGTFVPAPRPEVVGKGLEGVQTAVDRLMKGVSATKLVVTL